LSDFSNQIAFRVIAYFSDAALWLISSYVMLTYFFGYRVKPQKHRKVLFLFFLIVYDVVNVAIFIYARKNGGETALIVELLILFLFVYWCIYTEENNKFKVFLAILAGIQITMTIMTFVSSIVFTFDKSDYTSNVMNIVIKFGLMLFLEFTIICSMAWFSGRRRREPMSWTLTMATLVLFAMVNSILEFFTEDNSSQLRPMSRLSRVLMDMDVADQYTSIWVLGFALFLIVIFTLIIVKESEAVYFQRKNAISEYYLEAQKNHYESLLESNREIRKIKHDMKNHMFCLKELTDKQDYAALNQYISDLTEHLSYTERMRFTKNEIVDAIIQEKMRKTDALGIVLQVEGELSGIEISALDLCTIFSNLIDNAIEAVCCLESKKKEILISIKRNKNFLIVTQSNPIEKPIIIQDNRIVTSKDNKEMHGFGIINIQEAIAKYDGECQLFTKEDKVFVFEIVLPIVM